jgi:hypothetical protein
LKLAGKAGESIMNEVKGLQNQEQRLSDAANRIKQRHLQGDGTNANLLPQSEQSKKEKALDFLD